MNYNTTVVNPIPLISLSANHNAPIEEEETEDGVKTRLGDQDEMHKKQLWGEFQMYEKSCIPNEWQKEERFTVFSVMMRR